MRGCRACRGLIPEAVYGDLEAGSREKLDRHLARCPECAHLFADLAATVRKFDVRPAPAAPPEFWERLEKRMAAEAPRPSRTLLAPRWAYGLAGAAVILALGIFIGREMARRTTPPIVATRAVPQGAAPATLRAAHYLKR